MSTQQIDDEFDINDWLYVEKDNYFINKKCPRYIILWTHQLNRRFKKEPRPMLNGKSVTHAAFVRATARITTQQLEELREAANERNL